MKQSRNSRQTPSHSEKRKPNKSQGHKQRNMFLTLIFALLPIFIISGIAFSSYLNRPPELPAPDNGIIGETAEGAEETRGETPEGTIEGNTEGTSEGTAEGTLPGTEGGGKDSKEGTAESSAEGTAEGEPGETAEGTTGKTEQKKPVHPPKQLKENFYTFVVTGTDYEGYHTDTIMVIALDTAARKAHIVSVPRDSQVDVPGAYKKINIAYANGGTKELKRQLKSILGFAPQYSIMVDLEAFPKLVDAVGGVEFDVPQDMDMDDGTQNLHIHLVKGPQVLDGDKALQLVRFRGYPSADLGRMQTQQQFLKALAREALSPANLLNINAFIDIFTQDIKTDIGLRDLQWFAQQAVKLNPETDITVQTLPHSDDGNYLGQNYLFLSPEGVVEMVNSTINPYTTAITADDLNIIRIEDKPQQEVNQEMLLTDTCRMIVIIQALIFGQ